MKILNILILSIKEVSLFSIQNNHIKIIKNQQKTYRVY